MSVFKNMTTEELQAMLNRQMSADGFAPNQEFSAALQELRERQRS